MYTVCLSTRTLSPWSVLHCIALHYIALYSPNKVGNVGLGFVSGGGGIGAGALLVCSLVTVPLVLQ